MAKITYTLNEIARNMSTDRFSSFCDEFGFDIDAVKERGGYGVNVTLSLKHAKQYGLLDVED